MYVCMYVFAVLNADLRCAKYGPRAHASYSQPSEVCIFKPREDRGLVFFELK